MRSPMSRSALSSAMASAVALAAVPTLAVGIPAVVSPGGAGGARLSEQCPLFSWSQIPDAAGYEMAVYELGATESETELVLHLTLPAGSGAWMPGADACLSAGTPYAWRVRATTADGGIGEWSKPALFDVVVPSRSEVVAALDVLHRYLEGTGRDASAEVEALAGKGGVEFQHARVFEEGRLPEPQPFPASRASSVASPGETAGASRTMPQERAASLGLPAAIRAIQAANGYGVYAETATGRAVMGTSTATAGPDSGVFGETQSTQGAGVVGSAVATSGVNYGVYGGSLSAQGVGVYGYASWPSGFSFGVYGRSDSYSGTGVQGFAADSVGFNYGVRGETVSSVFGSAGVRGVASATSGDSAGVFGSTSSTQGRGVWGRAFATTGVTYGIFGRADSPTGYAGYFDGRVHVAGTLTKSAGAFKIDHPLDPENRYLSHSFVESSEMMNIYNGNVTLDQAGSAWVQLPDWFEALNRDFRYQLTALGESAPNLFVAERIEDNRFRIAGGKPGMSVSWQVTGIRHDPYALQHPIEVEEDKGERRGFYLNPEVYGLPAERAIYRATSGPGDAASSPVDELDALDSR